MDSDVEQLGRIAAAIMLAGVGLFMLLQALRSRRHASVQPHERRVEAAPE